MGRLAPVDTIFPPHTIVKDKNTVYVFRRHSDRAVGFRFASRGQETESTEAGIVGLRTHIVTEQLVQ